MKKQKTNFLNVRVGSYTDYETLEGRDRRICEENDEQYTPSELTETIQQYTVNKMCKTDFITLTTLAKELEDNWGLSLIIEPNGTLLIYNTDY